MYQLLASRGYITSSVDVFTAMWPVFYSFDFMRSLFVSAPIFAKIDTDRQCLVL